MQLSSCLKTKEADITIFVIFKSDNFCNQDLNPMLKPFLSTREVLFESEKLEVCPVAHPADSDKKSNGVSSLFIVIFSRLSLSPFNIHVHEPTWNSDNSSIFPF